ncbi:MAG: hypothetical protein QG565_643 [Campylobacterota bacterium]|nr:hypothetical protein [Campylobacterota bacterium]MDQ1268149.1 hypothetical protein [Campylobacterota bacterium]MDQ1337833.1 hypothetical protein [Campylobacterota bacterium]
MKKIAFILLNIFVFTAITLYLLPKENLYYLLEQNLEKEGVVFNNEKFKDKGLRFEVRDSVLFYKGIESANIGKTRFDFFLLYNTVVFKGVIVSNIAQNFMPLYVNRVDFSYTIFDPLSIRGRARGEFGEADIFLHLTQKKIKVILSPSEMMLQKYKNSLKKFKKSEDGEYVYEQNI